MWGRKVTAGAADRQRFARVALSFLAEPGEPALGALLRCCDPAGIVAAVSSGSDPRAALPAVGVPGLARAVERWRARLGRLPSDSTLAGWERAGLRLACPGDPEWPTQLDVLGDARPLVLWLQGSADLRFACLRSVSVVGARAATGYGEHVATELAATLAERGWAVVSGGANSGSPGHCASWADQRICRTPRSGPGPFAALAASRFPGAMRSLCSLPAWPKTAASWQAVMAPREAAHLAQAAAVVLSACLAGHVL
jgi:DNA recombination-mediator protein A